MNTSKYPFYVRYEGDGLLLSHSIQEAAESIKKHRNSRKMWINNKVKSNILIHNKKE